MTRAPREHRSVGPTHRATRWPVTSTSVGRTRSAISAARASYTSSRLPCLAAGEIDPDLDATVFLVIQDIDRACVGVAVDRHSFLAQARIGASREEREHFQCTGGRKFPIVVRILRLDHVHAVRMAFDLNLLVKRRFGGVIDFPDHIGHAPEHGLSARPQGVLSALEENLLAEGDLQKVEVGVNADLVPRTFCPKLAIEDSPKASLFLIGDLRREAGGIDVLLYE